MERRINLKKFVVVVFLFAVLAIDDARTDDDFPLKKELEAYRNLKSREFAQTGKKITDAVKFTWSPQYRTFGNDDDKTIYVLEDNYNFIFYDRTIGDVDYTLKGVVKGEIIKIRIDEIITGTIVEDRIEYFIEPKNITFIYEYFITPEGLKLGSESPFNRYLILEKDVPLLLERIRRTRSDN